MKSKEIALREFAKNKALDEAHITSDNTVFATKHQAESHAQRLKDKNISSYKREEVYTEAINAKNAAAKKALELKAQKQAEEQAKAEAAQKAKEDAAKKALELKAQKQAEEQANVETDQKPKEAVKDIEVKGAKQVAPTKTKTKSNPKKRK